VTPVPAHPLMASVTATTPMVMFLFMVLPLVGLCGSRLMAWPYGQTR
jgi:hypothetical protein